MKNLIVSLYIIFFIASSVYCQNLKDTNQENPGNINLIFAENSFHNIKTEDASATAQILANHIKNLKNLKNNFIVKLAKNDKEILEMCKDDFDLVLLTTEQYLRLKKQLPLEPFSTNFTDGSYGFDYQFFIKTSNGIKP